ncbi:MAG: SDR family NAD(P)-dependent oxidoreductase [Halioglobus sp.]
MKELSGKVAVISGGAEGIGLGLAKALGGHGMSIVVADINAQQLAKAQLALEQAGVPVLVCELDVASVAQWEEVTRQAIERFGKIHMLVNNAGVGGSPKPIGTSSEQDWRWILDVNLMGVVNGAQAVVPHITAHGEGGWIVNVASMAGFVSLPAASAYSATKAAVVAMSECWRAELAPQGVKVSVLCPGFVKTRINLSQRNRPAHYEEESVVSANPEMEKAMGDQMQAVIDAGASTELIARRVVEAMEQDEFYIITHPNFLPVVAHRFQEVTGAFERAARSSLLADIVEQKIPGFEQ